LIVLILGGYAVWQYAVESFAPKPFIIIYIRADGSVEPSSASILNVGNSNYTFTADIYGSIVVERNNIVVDGANYILQGRNETSSRGDRFEREK
jgi:hypothetical protein